ncbi:MAG: amidohydrolase family protein [Actinomycetota bacterium]|nr:amidohydrolase family protein [Actinomycetota bacterium]MDA3019570.1 amidohydrolase family protein [Actinomycetota bacterium]
MRELPKIISVDDHITEPATVWSDRLPSKYADVGPRVHRLPVKQMTFVGGTFTAIPGEKGEEGPLADWWFYEDLRRPLTRLDTAVGFSRDEVILAGITYDEMRQGSYKLKERLEDMDTAGIEASLCFPTFPRFCGQTFYEAKDKELAMLCVRAYNDWMVEEWCGESGGRMLPLCIIPLWDPVAAAAEVRRNAARGVHAVCFSEIPTNLGLPSIHDKDGYWKPFFAACNETATTINMHIGSGSKMPSTSPDAPAAVGSTLTFANCCFSMVDWLMSGVFTEFPNLKIAYSEGQIGWIPYILERANNVWEENRGWGGIADKVLVPPSQLFKEHIYGCYFDDPHGLRSLEEIGVDNVTFECDYPHSDSTWPHTAKIAAEQTRELSDEVVYKLMRGNAIKMLSITHLK